MFTTSTVSKVSRAVNTKGKQRRQLSRWVSSTPSSASSSSSFLLMLGRLPISHCYQSQVGCQYQYCQHQYHIQAPKICRTFVETDFGLNFAKSYIFRLFTVETLAHGGQDFHLKLNFPGDSFQVSNALCQQNM